MRTVIDRKDITFGEYSESQRKFLRHNIGSVPNLPGVYIFRSGAGEILYVGKSINLRERIKSYFGKVLGPKTQDLVNKVDYFSYIVVNSEVESLLLEAFIVQKYKPKYNIELKDDKSPVYIAIIKDKYPYIATLRKTQIQKENIHEIFGPFISVSKVRVVLQTLRKIVPFSTHKPSKKLCFYSQLGLCNPCPSYIESIKDEKLKEDLTRKYMMNLKQLNKILKGGFAPIKKELVKRIKQESKKLNYETAMYYKERLNFIEQISQPQVAPRAYLENPMLIEDIISKELSQLKSLISRYISQPRLSRIECYDVAHLGGSFATASMVTFVDGLPQKNLYRHFRIRQPRTKSDTDSLEEIAKRRIKLIDQIGKPDLIIVDGGRPQVSVFSRLFYQHDIPVVGIAKGEERLVFSVKDSGSGVYKIIRIPPGPALNLIQKIRNEAHRFARRYHHHLIIKNLLKN